MVEEAIVLVVHEEQHRLAPNLGIRRQRIQHLRCVPSPKVRRPVPVLRVSFRRHNPRYLRQPIPQHILADDVEQRSALRDVGSGPRIFRERAVVWCVLVLEEIQQRIVAVVPYIRVIPPAPKMCCVEARASVLINLPGDSRLVQPLRVSRPPIAQFRVVDHRAAAASVIAHPTRPHVIPVRVRRSQQRAMVRIANRECVRQGAVKGNIVPREVRHRGRALVRHPLVVVSSIPCCVRPGPVVRRVLQELQAQIAGIRMEGQQEPVGVAGVRLMKHALAGGQLNCSRIAEPAHAAQCPEVVIEGAVFLHHENNVLDVVDRPGAVIGRYCQRAADARRKSG